MQDYSAVEMAIPPPPYSETPARTSKHVESASLGVLPSRQSDFLEKAKDFRRSYEAEGLRSFLLALLKIDYNVPRLLEQEDADLGFARYYKQFARMYRNSLQPQPGATRHRGEMRQFLLHIADLLQTLNLQAKHVDLMLREYRTLTKNGKPYRSAVDALVVTALVQKLWRDRTHMIDALVPKEQPLLRAQLHSALQVAQTRLFDFIQSPTDFQLAPLGRECQKRDDYLRGLEKEKANAKEARAVARRKERRNHGQRCVLS